MLVTKPIYSFDVSAADIADEGIGFERKFGRTAHLGRSRPTEMEAPEKLHGQQQFPVFCTLMLGEASWSVRKVYKWFLSMSAPRCVSHSLDVECKLLTHVNTLSEVS